MPNTKSAERRMRGNKRKEQHNRSITDRRGRLLPGEEPAPEGPGEQGRR